MLAEAGYGLSERSIRLYLRELEADGLTESLGRRGRLITAKGLAELHASQTLDRVGYLSAKIDQLTYAMTFDLAARTGQVIVNTSLVDPRRLAERLDSVCKVFACGYAMGNRVALLAPGQSLGDLTVPDDRVGFCTVCSVTLNGVLLKHGVPTASRFGGLLELRDSHPTRFVELIHYGGTSIDPLEVFIRSGMTNYIGAITDGNGLIGASYREVPEASRDLVVHLADRLEPIGLGGFMEIGLPGQAILDFPVTHGRIGAVMIGGLNPIAILEETGHRIESRALAGLIDYTHLFHVDELPKALKQYV
jgi:repressor of nif and glnA expression